jgi:hypothetical protein
MVSPSKALALLGEAPTIAASICGYMLMLCITRHGGRVHVHEVVHAGRLPDKST